LTWTTKLVDLNTQIDLRGEVIDEDEALAMEEEEEEDENKVKKWYLISENKPLC